MAYNRTNVFYMVVMLTAMCDVSGAMDECDEDHYLDVHTMKCEPCHLVCGPGNGAEECRIFCPYIYNKTLSRGTERSNPELEACRNKFATSLVALSTCEETIPQLQRERLHYLLIGLGAGCFMPVLVCLFAVLVIYIKERHRKSGVQAESSKPLLAKVDVDDPSPPYCPPDCDLEKGSTNETDSRPDSAYGASDTVSQNSDRSSQSSTQSKEDSVSQDSGHGSEDSEQKPDPDKPEKDSKPKKDGKAHQESERSTRKISQVSEVDEKYGAYTPKQMNSQTTKASQESTKEELELQCDGELNKNNSANYVLLLNSVTHTEDKKELYNGVSGCTEPQSENLSIECSEETETKLRDSVPLHGKEGPKGVPGHLDGPTAQRTDAYSSEVGSSIDPASTNLGVDSVSFCFTSSPQETEAAQHATGGTESVSSAQRGSANWKCVMELYGLIEAEVHRFKWIRGCLISEDHLEIVINIPEDEALKHLKEKIPENLQGFMALSQDGSLSVEAAYGSYGSGCRISNNQKGRNATVTLVGTSNDESYAFSVGHITSEGASYSVRDSQHFRQPETQVTHVNSVNTFNVDALNHKVYDGAIFHFAQNVPQENNVEGGLEVDVDRSMYKCPREMFSLMNEQVLVLCNGHTSIQKGIVKKIAVAQENDQLLFNMLEICGENGFRIEPGQSGSLVSFLPEAGSQRVRAFAMIVGHMKEEPSRALAVHLWENLSKVSSKTHLDLKNMNFDRLLELESGIGTGSTF